MKKLFISILFIVSSISIAQSATATTEDGKKVVLKSDKTWDYISKTVVSENDCTLEPNYVEPKSEKGINSWLKKFDATTEDLKNHVAVENECEVKDVKLLNISEQKGNGMYSLCVSGKKMKYRRMGTVFSRLDEELFKGK
ncbi:DUF3157 family protein [Flavobacterium sp. Arc3]|uniref:DUF3157 family protein n=1 Tax=Flavobacterium sp. Arc3 TaxID=3046686 RepID=UPI00352C81D8